MPNSISQEDIRSKLTTYLVDECGVEPEEVSPDNLLFSTGLINSVIIVSMLGFFEEEFEIQISPFDVGLDNFDSVGRMTSFILTKLQDPA